MTGGHPVRVDFPGHDGLRLSGILHPAVGPERGTVVLAHCFTCSKEFKILAWLSRELSARGYTCLRFDFAGLGESQGDFADTTLSTDVADLLAAAEWARSRHQGPLALVGHSMGGAAALLAARSLPSIRVVVTLATSAQVGNRIRRLLTTSALDELERTGVTRVRVGREEYPVSVGFLAELGRISLAEELAVWDGAYLSLYGDQDSVVPLAEAEALYAAAPQPKAWVTVPGADHLFGAQRGHAQVLASLIDAWIALNGGTEP